MSTLTKHRFADLYEMGSGVSTAPEQAGHGYPFASFSTIFNNSYLPEELPDLMETTERQRFSASIKEGDILITRTSETIDELAMSSVAVKDYPNAAFSGFAKRLRPKQTDITYAKFMAPYLRSDFFRKIVNANAVMTLRASFNEDIFSYLEIYLPDYPTQVKIGDLFWNIEQKKRANESLIRELECAIQDLFKQWFIRWNFPNKDGKPYKTSGGVTTMSSTLKQEIPEGWQVAGLFNSGLCTDIKPGVKRFDEKTYIPTANVDGETIFQGNTISFEGRESRANMTPSLNSIWFAKLKKSIKHISIPDNGGWFVDNYILSTGFLGLACHDYSFSFVHALVNTKWFEVYKDKLSHGATQEGVNNDDLELIQFAVPPKDLLIKFNEVCYPMLKKKFSLMKEILEFQEFEKTCFAHLYSGVAKIV